MSEPSPLHVVVRDLTDALRPERLPAQIFPAVPPAGRTGQPLSLGTGILLRRGPIPPGMVFERVRAQRRQLDDELLAHRGREEPGMSVEIAGGIRASIGRVIRRRFLGASTTQSVLAGDESAAASFADGAVAASWTRSPLCNV